MPDLCDVAGCARTATSYGSIHVSGVKQLDYRLCAPHSHEKFLKMEEAHQLEAEGKIEPDTKVDYVHRWLLSLLENKVN